MSAEVFPYDVFLSHSAKDKAVVRPLAERLRADVLRDQRTRGHLPLGHDALEHRAARRIGERLHHMGQMLGRWHDH
mgnify:CR=1 FL=1